MSVVHVFPTYVPSLTEGISKNVHGLVEALGRAGAESRLDAPSASLEALNRRRIHLTNGWRAHRIARRALCDPRVGLVHYHVGIPGLGGFARLARWRARSPRAPLVLHVWNPIYRREEVHGAPRWIDRAYHRAFNGAWAAGRGLRGLDGILVSSEYQARQMQDLGVEVPIHVAPNGVDVDAYAPANLVERSLARSELGVDGDPLVLYYGHLSTWKGVDQFLDALPLLFRHRPDARALVAHTAYGNGEARLRARLQELGIADRVHIRGPSHVPTLLAAADIVVVPPIAPIGTACHPNTVLEILSAGLPLVASRVGSIPEAVRDGETGVLFSPARAEDLADQLVRLADDPAERRRLGRAARADVVARFGWDTVARRVLQVYRGLGVEAEMPVPAPAPRPEPPPLEASTS